MHFDAYPLMMILGVPPDSRRKVVGPFLDPSRT
jgi:hypothetical protein